MQFIKLLLPILFPWPLWCRQLAWTIRKKNLADQWAVMSIGQKIVLMHAYQFGSEYYMGETMRAICWQESSAGMDLENEEDGSEGSYGHFGINPVIAATRIYKTWPEPPTGRQVAVVITYLEQFEFGARQCRDEIIYWQGKYAPNHWTKIWASYNAGHDWKKGRGYARDIMDKIIFLREVA